MTRKAETSLALVKRRAFSAISVACRDEIDLIICLIRGIGRGRG